MSLFENINIIRDNVTSILDSVYNSNDLGSKLSPDNKEEDQLKILDLVSKFSYEASLDEDGLDLGLTYRISGKISDVDVHYTLSADNLQVMGKFFYIMDSLAKTKINGFDKAFFTNKRKGEITYINDERSSYTKLRLKYNMRNSKRKINLNRELFINEVKGLYSAFNKVIKSELENNEEELQTQLDEVKTELETYKKIGNADELAQLKNKFNELEKNLSENEAYIEDVEANSNRVFGKLGELTKKGVKK